MSSQAIRVAVSGLGGHAMRNVLPALHRSPQVDLVAAHTRDDAVLGNAVDAFGIRACRSSEALLASPDVDAVYVATPTGLHFDAAMAILASGKHVWCEKPLTNTYQGTLDVVAEAQRRGLVVLEADMFLHHPQFALLQSIVESGEVGEIRTVTGRFGFPHRPAGDFRYTQDLGGGALLDAGFYPVAAAVALLGDGLEVVGSSLLRGDQYEVDIGGTAMLTNGSQVAIADWGFGRSYRSELEVWGEQGTVFAFRAYAKPADLVTFVTVDPQSGDKRSLEVEPADHFERMISHFAAVTRDGRSEPADVLERARLLEGIRKRATDDTQHTAG